MCRNIRVLYHFEPPTTGEEVRAAALQYVRKVSGLAKPSVKDQVPFDEAVDQIAASTELLLKLLQAQTAVRTREAERDRARARWTDRAARAGQQPRGAESAAVPAAAKEQGDAGHSHGDAGHSHAVPAPREVGRPRRPRGSAAGKA